MPARELALYGDYTREEVHDIFAPDTPFTPQRGTWGLHGIVRVPEREGDFVFFVTFGQSQGEHVFDEGVTENGVLTWQSQPRQTLEHPVIQQLITHDELRHSIYLFLRTARDRPYTFLGRLKYVSHDRDRERPVYFQWQILDWQMDEATSARIGLRLEPDADAGPQNEAREAAADASIVAAGLTETEAPVRRGGRQGVRTSTFRARKAPDYEARDAVNRELGLAGEKLVLEYEQERLRAQGQPDLAEKVRHVSMLEGDGAGYDILSYDSEGTHRYIEVKTTRGSAQTAFYLSSNELAFSQECPSHYFLYRVYDFESERGAGRFYILSGALDTHFELEPLQYRALRRQSIED